MECEVNFTFYHSKNHLTIMRILFLYRKGEFDDWADEMARKGLFQGVPLDSLKEEAGK